MIYRFKIDDSEEDFVMISKCIQLLSLPNKHWDAYLTDVYNWETTSFPNPNCTVKADVYFDRSNNVIYLDTAAQLRNGDSGHFSCNVFF